MSDPTARRDSVEPSGDPAHPLATGLDRVLAAPPAAWRELRLGLCFNQASVDRELRLASDALAQVFPPPREPNQAGKAGKAREPGLCALFGPQHGVWSEAQDDMIETPHARDPRLGLPVWSLYGATRAPRPEWLADLDLVLVDLPDVGCRVYTYIWTVVNLLRVAAETGTRVAILDRPDPIGPRVEGPLLEREFQSFVGGHPIPLRHGATLGELARLVVRETGLDVELEVVAPSGPAAAASFPSWRRPWVPPSPNLPRFEGAVLYPGTVLFEGTNVSEGRGTTTPFELIGAPWIDPHRWRDALLERLPADAGLRIRPMRFEPTFHKHAQQSCGGLFLHVIDPERVASVALAAELFATHQALWPGALRWKEPPYEYETERPPIDILTGSSAWRTTVDAGATPSTTLDETAWHARLTAART